MKNEKWKMENEKWIIDNYFYDGLIPHPGLDPRSAANINTEVQRHSYYVCSC